MSTLTRLRTVFTGGEPEKSHPYECLGYGTCFIAQRQVCSESAGILLNGWTGPNKSAQPSNFHLLYPWTILRLPLHRD